MPVGGDPITSQTDLLTSVAQQGNIPNVNVTEYLKGAGGNHTEALRRLLRDNGLQYSPQQEEAAHKAFGLKVFSPEYIQNNKLSDEERSKLQQEYTSIANSLNKGKSREINTGNWGGGFHGSTMSDAEKMAQTKKLNELDDRIAKDYELSTLMPNVKKITPSSIGPRSLSSIKNELQSLNDESERLKETGYKPATEPSYVFGGAGAGSAMTGFDLSLMQDRAAEVEKKKAEIKQKMDSEYTEEPAVLSAQTAFLSSKAFNGGDRKESYVNARYLMNDRAAKLKRQMDMAIDDYKSTGSEEDKAKIDNIFSHIAEQSRQIAIGYSLADGVEKYAQAAVKKIDAEAQSIDRAMPALKAQNPIFGLLGGDEVSFVKSAAKQFVLGWKNSAWSLDDMLNGKGQSYEKFLANEKSRGMAEADATMPAAYRGTPIDAYVDVDGQKFLVDGNGDIQGAVDKDFKDLRIDVNNEDDIQKKADAYEKNRGQYEVHSGLTGGHINVKKMIGANTSVALNMIPIIATSAAIAAVPGGEATAVQYLGGIASSGLMMFHQNFEDQLKVGKGFNYAWNTAGMITLAQSLVEQGFGVETGMGTAVAKSLKAKGLKQELDGFIRAGMEAPTFIRKAYDAYGKYIVSGLQENAEEEVQSRQDAAFNWTRNGIDKQLDPLRVGNTALSMLFSVGGLEAITHIKGDTDASRWHNGYIRALIEPEGTNEVIDALEKEGALTSREATIKKGIISGSKKMFDGILADTRLTTKNKQELLKMMAERDRWRMASDNIEIGPGKEKYMAKADEIDNKITEKWDLYNSQGEAVDRDNPHDNHELNNITDEDAAKSESAQPGEASADGAKQPGTATDAGTDSGKPTNPSTDQAGTSAETVPKTVPSTDNVSVLEKTDAVGTAVVPYSPAPHRITFYDTIGDNTVVENEKGQEGVIKVTEGGVVSVEYNNNQTHELGNLDDLSDKTLDEFGLKVKNVESMNSRTYKVGNDIYVSDDINNAIKRDQDGNVVSVTLSKVEGGKVAKTEEFTGQQADNLAYQIVLDQFSKIQSHEGIRAIEEAIPTEKGSNVENDNNTKETSNRRSNETVTIGKATYTKRGDQWIDSKGFVASKEKIAEINKYLLPMADVYYQGEKHVRVNGVWYNDVTDKKVSSDLKIKKLEKALNEKTDSNTTTETPKVENVVQPSAKENAASVPQGEKAKQQLANKSQEEFAQYLQNNHSDNLSQEQIYKLLTVRPELRERMLNESPEEWAKIFEKNPDYRQQAYNVDNNKEMRGNSNPAWTGISIGETTNQETDGRHKGYVTLGVDSAREMGKNLEQTFKDLYKRLKDAGYNGHLKMPSTFSDLLTRFDNVVIHGATKGDVSLALPIIEQYFKEKGLAVEGTKTGIDAKDSSGKETSHTNLLAEKVKNKQLTKESINEDEINAIESRLAQPDNAKSAATIESQAEAAERQAEIVSQQEEKTPEEVDAQVKDIDDAIDKIEEQLKEIPPVIIKHEEGKLSLSGLTAEQQDAAEAKRVKETALSPKEKNLQNLVEAINDYEALAEGARGKATAKGNTLFAKALEAAAALGYTLKRFKSRDKTYVSVFDKDGSRINSLANNFKEQNYKSITTNRDRGLISNRSQEVIDLFKKLWLEGASSSMPIVYGVALSNAQKKIVFQDVADGIPSNGAEALLNQIEKSIKDGFIVFHDKHLGDMAVNVDDFLNDKEAEPKPVPKAEEKPATQNNNEEAPFQIKEDPNVKKARILYEAAQKRLNDVESRIAKDQAEQTDMFGDKNPQGKLFIDTKAEIKRVLYDLRKQVKDAKDALDRAKVRAEEEANKAQGQQSLFQAIKKLFVGEKMSPIGIKTFNQLIDNLNKSVGNVFGGVLTGKEYAQAVKDKAGRDISTIKGIVYGFVGNDGKVYINGDRINANTPVHEYGHVWISFTKNSAPDVYQRGLKLADKSSYLIKLLGQGKTSAYADLIKKYNEGDKAPLLEEALAWAIGDEGEKLVKSVKGEFVQWLHDLWENIKSVFGGALTDFPVKELQNLTFKQFTSIVARQLVSGTPITSNALEESVILRKVNNYAREIVAGRSTLKRLPPGAEQGRIEGGIHNVAASIISGRSRETDTGAREDSAENAGRRVKEQSQRLEVYAKSQGIWVEPEDLVDKFGKIFKGGSESTIHLNGDGYVTKVNNLSFYGQEDGNLLDFFDRIAIHNHLFPTTKYTLVGFTNDLGGLLAIVRQPFIANAVPTHFNDTTPYMHKLGFKGAYGTYYNDNYIVRDLHQDNILTGEDGRLYVIDPAIRLNNQARFGGKMVAGDIDIPDEPIAQEEAKLQKGEFNINVNGTPTTVKPLPEGVDVVNGFYSNTEKAIVQVGDSKMTGGKWISTLLSKGANKEEMHWTGLEGYLKDNANKSVSKADIQKYLKENRISVVEVVKGENKNWEQTQKNTWVKRQSGKRKITITETGGKFYAEPSYTKFVQAFNSLEEAQSHYDNIEGYATDTKYHDKQLEGQKENYKEVLVTMPNKEVNISDFVDKNADYIIEAYQKSGKLKIECP